MELDFSDLLAKIKSDLQSAPAPEYLQPTRRTQYFEYLVSPDSKLREIIQGFYLQQIQERGYPDILPDYLEQRKVTIILHGHEFGQGCAAPYFCHELGYWPTGSENPNFIKAFEKKWKKWKKL